MISAVAGHLYWCGSEEILLRHWKMSQNNVDVVSHLRAQWREEREVRETGVKGFYTCPCLIYSIYTGLMWLGTIWQDHWSYYRMAKLISAESSKCNTSTTNKASKGQWWNFELCDTSATSKASKAKWWNFELLTESLVWYPWKIIDRNSQRGELVFYIC